MICKTEGCTGHAYGRMRGMCGSCYIDWQMDQQHGPRYKDHYGGLFMGRHEQFDLYMIDSSMLSIRYGNGPNDSWETVTNNAHTYSRIHPDQTAAFSKLHSILWEQELI